MSVLETPMPAAIGGELTAYFEGRAAEVDAGGAGVRHAIAFVARRGLLDGDRADLDATIGLIAAIAWSDLSSAFSLWCHRMAIAYLETLPPAAWLRREVLPRLLSGEVLGSTALAGATAHYLSRAPLSLTFERDGDEVVLNGRLPWASNLLPDFVSVTAAVDAHDEQQKLIVAFGSRTPGVEIDPYPPLLALQATGSSSLRFRDARIGAEWIVSDDLDGFVRHILPTFLLLQCAFCAGLARRGLDEAAEALGGQREVLRPALETLQSGLAAAEVQLHTYAGRPDGEAIPLRDLLALRLEWAGLAGEAVGLELKAAGGRGYLRSSGTARRLREAAFLPIQAPTEVQLRWALSRFA
ncbi:MAG: acyl-CoA dehydrogenase family protein [Chloroflexota bacterium]